MNERSFSFKDLTKAGQIYEKDGSLYLNFDNFEPFKVEKIKTGYSDLDCMIIFESGEATFEYWHSQKVLIPSWETHWFQLKDNFLLKLRDGLLRTLIKGVSKRLEILISYVKNWI